MKILTVDQMRRAEQDAAKIGLPPDVLMENAGRAVAEEIRRMPGAKERPVLVLVGPGNNGGDGLVTARYLDEWGFTVAIYFTGTRRADDPNLEKVRRGRITLLSASQDGDLKQLDSLLASTRLVVDAVFGTGKSRPIGEPLSSILEKVRDYREKNTGVRIAAVDLPSGMDADSGAADPACLYADITITLGFPKTGLFNMPGAAHAGRIKVVDIGIPVNVVRESVAELITAEMAGSLLPRRPLMANKGTFGRVMVIAGSINYIGAAYLACSGALRVGAGLVTLATAISLQPILASKLTEVTYLPLAESSLAIVSPEAAELVNREVVNYNTLLLGCGLGQEQSVKDFIGEILANVELPRLVLDADALNTLAGIPEWWRRLPQDAILTPHPGEMARLAEVPVEDVQANRAGIAGKMAVQWHKTVVLKGAYTVIATPEGRVRVSPVANPGLASAGTGDVLAGAVAGLVAQGLSLFDAASAAVYLHGEAGEMVRARLGDAGMLASDLLPVLPRAIKRLKANS